MFVMLPDGESYINTNIIACVEKAQYFPSQCLIIVRQINSAETRKFTYTDECLRDEAFENFFNRLNSSSWTDTFKEISL